MTEEEGKTKGQEVTKKRVDGADQGTSSEIISYELSEEHEQTLNKVFSLLQKKGTKKKNEVDERDVPLLLRALGLNPTDRMIEQIILKAKSRQSSKITQGFLDFPYFEEAFAEAFTSQKDGFSRHTEAQILAAFRAITPNNEDFLEPQVLKKLLMEKGASFSDDEVDRMIKAFKDKDTGLLWHDDMAELLAKDGLPPPSKSKS